MMLSWFKRSEKFDTYSTTRDTPEEIKKMREAGFIPMDDRIKQLLNEERP